MAHRWFSLPPGQDVSQVLIPLLFPIASLFSNHFVFNLIFLVKFYRHWTAQRENTDVKWTFKEDAEVVYSDVQGELTVGGVFLRLFIANPGWVLRKPKEFLTELLEKWSSLTSMTKPDVSIYKASVLHLYLEMIFKSTDIEIPLFDY